MYASSMRKAWYSKVCSMQTLAVTGTHWSSDGESQLRRVQDAVSFVQHTPPSTTAVGNMTARLHDRERCRSGGSPVDEQHLQVETHTSACYGRARYSDGAGAETSSSRIRWKVPVSQQVGDVLRGGCKRGEGKHEAAARTCWPRTFQVWAPCAADSWSLMYCVCGAPRMVRFGFCRDSTARVGRWPLENAARTPAV